MEEHQLKIELYGSEIFNRGGYFDAHYQYAIDARFEKLLGILQSQRLHPDLCFKIDKVIEFCQTYNYGRLPQSICEKIPKKISSFYVIPWIQRPNLYCELRQIRSHLLSIPLSCKSLSKNDDFKDKLVRKSFVRLRSLDAIIVILLSFFSDWPISLVGIILDYLVFCKSEICYKSNNWDRMYHHCIFIGEDLPILRVEDIELDNFLL